MIDCPIQQNVDSASLASVLYVWWTMDTHLSPARRGSYGVALPADVCALGKKIWTCNDINIESDEQGLMFMAIAKAIVKSGLNYTDDDLMLGDGTALDLFHSLATHNISRRILAMAAMFELLSTADLPPLPFVMTSLGNQSEVVMLSWLLLTPTLQRKQLANVNRPEETIHTASMSLTFGVYDGHYDVQVLRTITDNASDHDAACVGFERWLVEHNIVDTVASFLAGSLTEPVMAQGLSVHKVVEALGFGQRSWLPMERDIFMDLSLYDLFRLPVPVIELTELLRCATELPKLLKVVVPAATVAYIVECITSNTGDLDITDMSLLAAYAMVHHHYNRSTNILFMTPCMWPPSLNVFQAIVEADNTDRSTCDICVERLLSNMRLTTTMFALLYGASSYRSMRQVASIDQLPSNNSKYESFARKGYKVPSRTTKEAFVKRAHQGMQVVLKDSHFNEDMMFICSFMSHQLVKLGHMMLLDIFAVKTLSNGEMRKVFATIKPPTNRDVTLTFKPFDE